MVMNHKSISIKRLRLQLVAICVIAMLVISLCYGFVNAGLTVPVEDDLEHRVSRLIRALNSNSRQTRRRAEKELYQIGIDILPVLPPPELLPNDSVKEAVRRIRVRVEHVKAEQEIRPSTISINGFLTLKELFVTISQQTGNKIDFSPLLKSNKALDQKSNYNFKGFTFWEVLDKLSLKHQFSLATSSTTSDLRVIPEISRENISVCYSGPCRIEIPSAQIRDLIGSAQNKILRIRSRILVEPRLRPLFLQISSKNLVLTDETGKLFKPYNPDAKLELPLGEGGHQIVFNLDYLVAANEKPRQLSLEGEVKLLTAVGEQKISFPELSKSQGVARRRGGVTAKINKIELKKSIPNMFSALVLVAIAYDTGGRAFESHRTWVFHNKAYLKNSNGKRVERNNQLGTALQKDGSIVVEYRFDNLTNPVSTYQFVYMAPTLIVDKRVNIKVENIKVKQ